MYARSEQKTENGYKQSKPPTAPKPSRLLKQYSTPESSPESQSQSTSSTDQTTTSLKEPQQEQPALPAPFSSSTSSSSAGLATDQPPPLPTSAPPSKAARLGMRRHTVAEADSPKHSYLHHQEGGGGGLAGGLGNLHVHSSQTESRRSPLGVITESTSPDRHAVATKQPSPPTEMRASRSEAFPLRVFMETKAKDLPLQIHVDTGLYGNTMHSSLHPQDPLTAHFVLRTHVVRAALDRGGTYHIPCGSSNQFSLLFDPKNNIIEAMNGFYFESAADMMSHTPLPPVVRAVRSFQGPSSEFSVQEGDILLVSRRVKSRGVPKRKYISCYKAGTGEKKRLSESCTAGFTTRPEEIQLPLSEILSCRYTPLPLKAIMYHVGPSQDSPQVLTLLAKTVEESLVLSRPLCQDTDYSASRKPRKHVLRIRQDMDMSVYILALDEAEKKQLSEETYSFYQTFNFACINQHLFPEDPVWSQFERIQSSLYRNMRSDGAHASVELIEGTSKQLEKQRKKKDSEATTDALYQNTVIHHDISKSPHRSQRPSDYQTLTETKPEDMGNSPFWDLRTISPDVSTVQGEREKEKDTVTEELLLELMLEVNTANRQMSIQIDQLRGEKEAMSTDLHRVKNRIGEMNRSLATLTELKATVKSLQDTVLSLREEVEELKQNRESYASFIPAKASQLETENQEVLRSFSVEQVLQILHVMKLQEYVETFEKEAITGAVLVECDEDMLKTELNITSRLHCKKLLALIRGSPQTWHQLESAKFNADN